jgi:hexosaminidase
MGAQSVTAQQSALDVIPAPAHVELREGSFTLTDPVHIVADSSNPRLREIADFLAQALHHAAGLTVTVHQTPPAAPAILLSARGDSTANESYEITIEKGGARITGASVTGVFWGVQTLRQLLPPELERKATPGTPVLLPTLTIRDAPRFSWRGTLLDVSRHFFPVEFVEQYIDLLSRYKMNVLHWHLTDDQGWRIEVRRHPRLTEIGAWRMEDGARYGGFYTQDEIRRVVEYARLRNVTVVPEIEMPGHAQAAIASYPELGCTGQRVPVATQWGVMKEIYCAGNERTFEFLEGVLDEVMALFPSKYIHIGGDEVPKDRWQACESCQALMRREGLANEAELQTWFVARVGRYLREHGRTLIGWDEILEGGLPEGATVQVWRDMAHAATAANLGADVIASPTSHAYLDGSPRNLTLEKVYSFDPIPPDLDSIVARRILGGEANIWTEHIDTANFDLMAFPRVLAMAEALWTAGPRNYEGFVERLRRDHYARLRAIGVRPGPEDRDVLRLTTALDSATRSVRVLAERGVEDIVVRYTTDGSRPTAASPVLHDSTRFSSPGTVRIRPFVGDAPFPIERSFTVVEHAARGRNVALITPNSRQYPGTGPNTLTDGVLGSIDHHDGLWQGWIRTDLEAIVDLGAVRLLDSVGVSFLQATQSWILLPRDLAVMLSSDGVTWGEPLRASHDIPPERNDAFRHRLFVDLPPGARARYVKVVARPYGNLPGWHPGAGRPAWIFADEIIVR